MNRLGVLAAVAVGVVVIVYDVLPTWALGVVALAAMLGAIAAVRIGGFRR